MDFLIIHLLQTIEFSRLLMVFIQEYIIKPFYVIYSYVQWIQRLNRQRIVRIRVCLCACHRGIVHRQCLNHTHTRLARYIDQRFQIRELAHSAVLCASQREYRQHDTRHSRIRVLEQRQVVTMVSRLALLIVVAILPISNLAKLIHHNILVLKRKTDITFLYDVISAIACGQHIHFVILPMPQCALTADNSHTQAVHFHKQLSIRLYCKMKFHKPSTLYRFL